jgi:lysophospholipase L1-like esterase
MNPTLARATLPPPGTKVDVVPRAQRGSHTGHFLVKVCLAGTLAVVLLAMGELVSFVALRSGMLYIPSVLYNHPLPHDKEWTKEYWREFEQAQRRQYKPYVIWRRDRFRGRMINIDADGVRRTVPSQCDGRTYTIWMFGDSTLWGTGSADWETVASRLAEHYQQAGRPVCLVNYGETGWVNTQEVVALTLQLKRAGKKPDLVLFYDGTGDAFQPYASQPPEYPHNNAEYERRFNLWRDERAGSIRYFMNAPIALNNLADKLGLRNHDFDTHVSAPQADAMARLTVENYQQNMDIVAALAAKYGFRYLAFIHSTACAGHKPLTQEETAMIAADDKHAPGMSLVFRAAYEGFRKVMRPDVVYFGDVLDDQKDTLYLDSMHTLPEANRIIAERMFNVLQQRGL